MVVRFCLQEGFVPPANQALLRLERDLRKETISVSKISTDHAQVAAELKTTLPIN